MTPDRRLLQKWKAADPNGYRQTRVFIRICAPVMLALSATNAFFDAYEFYDYARFDNPSHRVQGLIVYETFWIGLAITAVRGWILTSSRD